MNKEKPKSRCNVYGKNVRFELLDNCIKVWYQLLNGREEFWEIPPDSDFEPPEWFVEGCSFKAWTVNRSTSRAYTDYDWVWITPMDEPDSPIDDTELTKRIKSKMREQLSNKFNDLFEGDK